MECTVCARSPGSDLGLFCVACARSSIYASRFEVAKVLLAKEQLAQSIENVVSPKTQEAAGGASQSLWNAEILKAQKNDTEARIEQIQEQTEILREELEEAKKDITARRAYLTSRKANLAAVKERTASERNQTETKIVETMKRGNQSFHALHDRSVETRAFLCREAAILMGLKQKKRRKGDNIVDQFYLAGLPMTNLKEIHNARCTELNAVMASISHLLVLTSFYLSVRLPNEMILPHRDSPVPVILKTEDSYTARRKAPSNATDAKSWSNHLSNSRYDDKDSQIRPRPLAVGSGARDERLLHVVKSDPPAFGHFIEGVSLLALNIAWLCKSQGLHMGTNSWEEICDIGKNLWQLLLTAPESAPTYVDAHPGRSTSNKKASHPSQENSASLVPQLGQGSHSSAHSFLGSPSTLERDFQLPELAILKDKLKRSLLAEINNAEWELVQEDEWDDGTEQFDEAVHIRTPAMGRHEFDDARSIMTARTRFEEATDKMAAPSSETNEEVKSAKPAGTSGWTRVKSRDK